MIFQKFITSPSFIKSFNLINSQKNLDIFNRLARYYSLSNDDVSTTGIIKNEKDLKLKIYKSTTNNPLFNIATEDWLFKELDFEHHVLFLWRNSPTVVIGRFQNPFKECHLTRMEEDGVVLARRYSGGGAVYQDLGNSNFTFLSPTEFYDKHKNTQIIIETLKSLNIPSPEASGRNDIVVNGKKVSGSAYKQSGPRSFHHGTLMIDVNLNNLQNYLNPNKDKLKSKGITSVISRVLNMKTINPELNHELISNELVKTFLKTYGKDIDQCEVIELNTTNLETIPSLKETYDSLMNWEWRFGTTPEFEHQFEKRFDWGTIDLNMNCQKGKITDSKIYSDSLNPSMIETVNSNLIGKKYSKEGIEEALNSSKNSFLNTEYESQIEELKNWLLKEI